MQARHVAPFWNLLNAGSSFGVGLTHEGQQTTTHARQEYYLRPRFVDLAEFSNISFRKGMQRVLGNPEHVNSIPCLPSSSERFKIIYDLAHSPREPRMACFSRDARKPVAKIGKNSEELV